MQWGLMQKVEISSFSCGLFKNKKQETLHVTHQVIDNFVSFVKNHIFQQESDVKRVNSVSIQKMST